MSNESVGEALPKEIARVRDVVLPAYLAIGPTGALGAAMIRHLLDQASRAIVEGNLPAMIAVYPYLKGFK